ncbi:Protein of unknown function [Cupriavidus sp. OV038]|jgi:hypothetical protein|uniref:DUF3016 domain-containing protein n=1 Tax=unclassified Cupriavidus TaxID=2640874 RepID=UPI0008DED76B|nr:MULTISPECIES: DUF3016 domain-containing protein [unclassified Cupriavidus]SFD04987.1 Protein of unknown function [Cupriavidus sp. OV038]SFP71267.1 Protein of unknown function [Cupriavidus sp. OV096]
MSTYFFPVLVALATLGVSGAAGGAPAPSQGQPSSALSVTFIHPETYTDASWSQSYGSDRQVLDDIRKHFAKLAARKLPEGYSLTIEVLDIDLAGYIDWRYAQQVRVIRDATWPRMTLQYELRHGDEVVASAQERISNMNFGWGVNLYGPSDRLRYEKVMIDDWFGRRIGKLTGKS